MEVCKYHVSSRAKWYCQACEIHSCSLCVSYPDKPGRPECVLCKRSLVECSQADLLPELKSQMGRLAMLASNATLFLLAFAAGLLIALFHGVKWSFVFQFLVLFPVFEVGFWLFEKASSNDLTKPKLGELLTYRCLGQAFRLALFFYFVLLINHQIALDSTFFAALLTLFFGLMTPAAIITLAVEKSLLSMFDPRKLIYVAKRLGKDYGILWLMFAAISSAALLLNQAPAATSRLALSMAFGLVVWMLFWAMLCMGYVVQRFKVELNYSSGLESLRVEAEKYKGRQGRLYDVDIFLQEGRFEDARARLLQLIHEDNAHYEAYERLIKLYLIEDNRKHALKFWQEYLDTMLAKNKSAQVAHFLSQLHQSGLSLPVEDRAQTIDIAKHWLNKTQWRLAESLLGDGPVRPDPKWPWEKHALLRVKLMVEFARDYEKAMQLIAAINKYSFDETVLAEAETYDKIIATRA